MEGGRLLRAARRRAGLSQRALAARSGVSASTVAAVEAGRREPGLVALTGLLAAAGLELQLAPLLPPPCEHLRRYLRLSVVERAYLTTGGRWHPVHDRRLPAWNDLWSLARCGRVELTGSTAAGLWTPVAPPVVQVRFSPWRAAGRAEPGVVQVVGPATERPGLVPVRMSGRTVVAPVPEELAEQLDDPGTALSVRVAARLLDEHAPVDDGSRRPPAHRDPDPRGDDFRVLHTRAFGRRPFPPPHDRRGWRLGGPVSLAQWLRGHGYPT